MLRGSGASTQTILVVDDESSIRVALQRILQRAGYAVLTAEDGEDALRVARAHAEQRAASVDLLLTDMVMPHMDGGRLVKQFTRLYPGAAVIRMSGYTESETTRAALSDASTPFLAKPFTVEAVTTMVREALSGRLASVG
jgi:DNA-binding NtrC family response regulator